jgi:Arc/MetJ-type ribon-helix-helix transcriptional regulator
MGSSVQARLDEETQKALDGLVRNLGMSQSEVIREGIRLMEKQHARPKHRRIIGVGQFETGIPDLSTNSKHMEGFGE